MILRGGDDRLEEITEPDLCELPGDRRSPDVLDDALSRPAFAAACGHGLPISTEQKPGRSRRLQCLNCFCLGVSPLDSVAGRRSSRAYTPTGRPTPRPAAGISDSVACAGAWLPTTFPAPPTCEPDASPPGTSGVYSC